MRTLWTVYCLPGRVFTLFAYLFPRRGRVIGTGRRKKSEVAHFVYASAFWAILLILIYVLVSP